MNSFRMFETRNADPATVTGHLTLVAHRNGVMWLACDGVRDLDSAVATMPLVEGDMVLIAGGAGSVGAAAAKRWAGAVDQRASWVLLFGAAAAPLARALVRAGARTTIVRCADIDDAIHSAPALAADGDTILLCACRPTEAGAPDPYQRFRMLAICDGREKQPAEAA